MAEKHHNHHQAHAAIVRRMEKAERDGDRAAWEAAKAELEAHDKDRAWDDAKAAGAEQRALAADQHRIDKARRDSAKAALALLDEIVAAGEAEVNAAEALAEAFTVRNEKMGELQRAAEDLGHRDFNFNGLTLLFEADLANRITTKGVRYCRGQTHGKPPEAALNLDILATIRRCLTRTLEG